jgi:hypothetical protein
MTAAHTTQRWHGRIVGSQTDDRGSVASVLVPGVVYQLRWPIDGANTAAGSVGSNG